MFENLRRGRQARNFTTNVPKILDVKSSSEQIFSENCRCVPLNIRSFMILRSREGLTFFNVDKSVIFSHERKYNEAFRDVYFLRIREKTLS